MPYVLLSVMTPLRKKIIPLVDTDVYRCARTACPCFRCTYRSAARFF